ncbi:hypothetical protein NKH69_09985 [Mesorhizobium sp. M0976]|uniref:hypothetical protein n=1 Tax=unclassified Mesorhizobium TaxID=325217 RepID=UPI003339D04E
MANLTPNGARRPVRHVFGAKLAVTLDNAEYDLPVSTALCSTLAVGGTYERRIAFDGAFGPALSEFVRAAC